MRKGKTMFSNPIINLICGRLEYLILVIVGFLERQFLVFQNFGQDDKELITLKLCSSCKRLIDL